MQTGQLGCYSTSVFPRRGEALWSPKSGTRWLWDEEKGTRVQLPIQVLTPPDRALCAFWSPFGSNGVRKLASKKLDYTYEHLGMVYAQLDPLNVSLKSYHMQLVPYRMHLNTLHAFWSSFGSNGMQKLASEKLDYTYEHLGMVYAQLDPLNVSLKPYHMQLVPYRIHLNILHAFWSPFGSNGFPYKILSSADLGWYPWELRQYFFANATFGSVFAVHCFTFVMVWASTRKNLHQSSHAYWVYIPVPDSWSSNLW